MGAASMPYATRIQGLVPVVPSVAVAPRPGPRESRMQADLNVGWQSQASLQAFPT